MSELISFDTGGRQGHLAWFDLPRLPGHQADEERMVCVIHWHGDIGGGGRLHALADGFKQTARQFRREGYKLSAYDLWRAIPYKNPRNQAAGSVGGTTAVANMNREQRRFRARKGGNTVFHGDSEGTDGVRASARGRLLARRRWYEHCAGHELADS